MNITSQSTWRSFATAGAIAVLLVACGQSDQVGDDSSAVDQAMAKVPVTTTSDEARDLYMQGRTLLDDLRVVDANGLFAQAVEADESFAMGYFMVATTSQTAAEFFDATSMANDRAASASEGEQLYIGALVAFSENDQARQREALEQLVAMFPQDERTHVQLGNFLTGQQDFSGAVEQYSQATEINPKFAGAYNALGYAHRSLDDLDSALVAFEEYVALIPDEANPYDSLAELMMEMGDYDESIETYRKALEINPYFAPSYQGIAVNHSLKGEPELAQEAADQMLAAARNFAERQGAMFRVVTSHLFAGNTEAAMEISEVMMAEAGAVGNHAAMGGIAEYMGDIMMVAGDTIKAEEYFDAALDHRLQADINEANKAQAARVHLFKTSIAAMIGDDAEAAASRAAEYSAAAEAHGTAFEKRRANELSAYLAMFSEENEAAAAHFDDASQFDPIVLYWSAVVNKDLGNMDKARELATRAANRNTLNANLPFFRADAMKLLEELSAE